MESIETILEIRVRVVSIGININISLPKRFKDTDF